MFRVAGDPYALPLSAVREVVASAARRRLPGQNEPWVVGMASVRGELMPVVDLAIRLRLAPARAEGPSVLLVVEVEGRVAAVEVEKVERLVDPGPLADAPPYAGPDAAAIAELGDELVIVLRAQSLLPA